MYRDRSLVPGEAVRLLALGTLMEADRRYGELATEIRFFTQRIVGPSLDLMGSSLELLRIEGLAETIEDTGDEGAMLLRITDQGREAFQNLMGAQLRAPINDVGRLTLLLKLRFLRYLPPEPMEDQIDLLIDIIMTEKARATDLAKSYAGQPIADWLAIDITQADQRIAWLNGELSKLDH